ncbi:hypothetical protein DVH24_038212 [Malus domestica]|uniref:DYW domain-containing protein n=1 Tax=Malus domestica TaxID=3750 RepID=A0A498K936_MALDO|nr:hypothetical protein DVH24_038212 [Malus domestica]
MPGRSVRSWTLMISGFVHCGKPKEAIGLFSETEEAGVRPNEVMVVTVLAACADWGDLGLGSCEVFDGMKERTVVSWSAMIAEFAMHGQAEEALRLFSKMIQKGMDPNDVTFVGLLHASSHIGFVDQGREFFTSMTNDYGIVPRIEHYGCMVDLLSRQGSFKRLTIEFITNMPIKPNTVVWGALLGGCKVHKNIELAEEATKHLSELDPLNDGYYVVLSNLYAEAQRWEDTTRVRKIMRDRGVKKTPAWSSITVDGVVHEFVAEDETRPQTQETVQMWEKLVEKMKLKGYVPNASVVLLDMEEDQKEKFLYRHIEKLALVFRLINTEPGTPIRIMKNLRVWITGKTI